MLISKLTESIANALESACGLDVTPKALEAIEGCLQKYCAANPELEKDLEVWRAAYNAAILLGDFGDNEQVEIADKALADYRQKREEMGL